jgi:hypothetical protein
MKHTLGQEPAFPFEEEIDGNYGKYKQVASYGMSKRFYAACAAMQGLIAGCDVNAGGFDAKWTAKAAWNMADELLKEENE